MPSKKCLRCVELALILIVFWTGCNESVPIEDKKVSVWIDGDPVLERDLSVRVAINLKAWNLDREASEQDINRVVDSCIRDMLVERVIRKEAARLGLKETHQATEYPGDAKEKYGEGFEFLEQSDKDWWNRVESGFQLMDLAGGIAEYLVRDIQITDEMLLEEYHKRQEYFTKPEVLELKLIRVYDLEAANEIYAQLKKKWKFETLAQKHSNLKGEGANGESVIRNVGELPSDFEVELLQLKPGEFSRVLASSEGYFIYKLIKKIPAEVLPFDAVRDRLRNDLVISMRSRVFQDWLDEEIKKIDVRRGTPMAVPGEKQ